MAFFLLLTVSQCVCVCVCVCVLSCVQLFATSWTLAHQAPVFMGFAGQEYWSGLPFPSPLLTVITTFLHYFLFAGFSPEKQSPRYLNWPTDSNF